MNESRPSATNPQKETGLPPRKDLQAKAHSNETLRENADTIEILLTKLEGGSLDIFDGQTVELLRKVLSSKDHNAVFKPMMGFKIFGDKWIGRLMSTSAGLVGGDVGAGWAKHWAENFVGKTMLDKGNALVSQKALAEAGLFNPKEGVMGTINGWLQSAAEATKVPDSPGFSAGIWEGIKGLAQTATHWGTAEAHAAFEQLLAWVNQLWVYIATFINLAVQRAGKEMVEMASGAGSMVAGFTAWPAGLAVAWGVSSFTVGGILGLVREMKRTAGFEQIAEYIERSEMMIEEGVKNDDGLDPRHELIALEKKISDDQKQMGHKLSNNEWLVFATAVRNARVSILREETGGYLGSEGEGRRNILYKRNEVDPLVRKAEILKQVIDGQNGIAEADLDLALETLSQYRELLADDIKPAERKVAGHNAAWTKTGRYVRGFRQAGLNATGIPIFLKASYRLTGHMVKAAIPGSSLIFNRSRKDKKKK